MIRRKDGGQWVAVYEFDADDCEAIAELLQVNDLWREELLDDAQALKEANLP